MSRHRWTMIEKAFGYDEARCERCGLHRVRRHDRALHWTEFHRDNVYIQAKGTPSCEPLVGAASVDPESAGT